jgi:hypothetical protein
MSINPLATTQAPPAHHRGHGHHKQAMDAAAQKLGMSSDDLEQALQGGQSLDDVAAGQGVSHDDLVAAISSGLQQAGGPGADATAVAERLAQRRWDQHRADAKTEAQPRTPLGSLVDVSA